MASSRRRLFALFVFFSLSRIFALEIAGETALTFFQPPDKGEESLFDTLHLWGNLQLAQDFFPSADYNVGFDIRVEHDPILLNRVIPRIGYRTRYLAVNLGPFLGVLNGDTSGIFPGLSLSLETVFPGKFFASLRLDSAIGRRQWETGDYTQDFILARTGFWLSNVIVRFEYSARFFSEKAVSGDYRNEWTRFDLSADFFKKNIPYRLLINAGYEHLSWMPINSAGPSYLLRAVYSGFELCIQLHSSFELNFGAEIPVYSWNSGPPAEGPSEGIMSSPNFSTFKLGFSWILPERTFP
ncbi:MAG: hypothetical protein LBP80_03415 [Treponema sp.]|jgi:hypothetical protein|nr:hypothetical protein [Treponema sp.]